MGAFQTIFDCAVRSPLSKGPRRKQPGRRRLSCEPLEDRRMMTAYSNLAHFDSFPGAPVTLYLDFDGAAPHVWMGQAVHGEGDDDVPVPGFTLDANPNDFTAEEYGAIEQIYKLVAEKFSPFNINVTTRPATVLQDGVSAAIVVGGRTYDWTGEIKGGCAYPEGFTRSDLPNHGFVFSADSINAARAFEATAIANGLTFDVQAHYVKFIGETIAHEAGHMFGLNHQSRLGPSGEVVEDYYEGSTLWSPIMGGSSNSHATRGVWWNGPASAGGGDDPNESEWTGFQDDLAQLTRPGNSITYRTDDYGSEALYGVFNTDLATGAVTAKGIIERVGDRDGFRFTAQSTTAHFDVKNADVGGMLAPEILVYPLNGSLPAPHVVAGVNTNWSGSVDATNLVPGAQYLVVVSPQRNEYGNLGQYTVTGNLGTFAAVNPTTGTLNVTGFDGDDNIAIRYDQASDRIIVQDSINGGAAVHLFPRAGITRISVDTGFGSNSLSILSDIDGLPVSFNGGGLEGGLYLQGTEGNDYFHVSDAGESFSVARFNNTVVTYRGLQRVELYGFSGDDTFDVAQTHVNMRLRIDGMNGDDVINIAPNDPHGIARIKGSVSVFGSAGDDTLNLGSGNVDVIDANITFYGGSGDGPFGDAVVFNDQGINYGATYDVSDATVARSGLLTHSHTLYDYERLIINAGSGHDQVTVRNGLTARVEAFGNGGDDIFTRGDGLIVATATASFHGGPGSDTMRFDDHANPQDIIWDVNQDRVLYGGIVPQDTAGFENVSILAGTGNNEITFARTISQAFDVDGGGGNDVFIISRATFAAPLSLHGAAGDDSFVWENLSENWYPLSVGEAHVPVSIDGGAGYNAWLVDNHERDQMSYEIFADRLQSSTFDGRPSGMDVAYDNIQAVTLKMGDKDNFLNVYGTASDLAPGNQFSILGGAGSDQLTVHPHDAQGNLTINGNLGFSGGDGDRDMVSIDDSTSNAPITYSFYNQYGPGTSNIGGLGAGTLGLGADVESFSIYGSHADDTFRMISHDAPTRFYAYGGNGNDVLDYMSYQERRVAVDLNLGTATAFSSIHSFERVLSPQKVDFIADNAINGHDFAVWAGAFGESAAGDADGDGATTGFDFLAWQLGFGMEMMAPVAPLATAAAQPQPAPESIDAAFDSQLFTLPVAETGDDEMSAQVRDSATPWAEIARTPYRPTQLSGSLRNSTDASAAKVVSQNHLDIAYAELGGELKRNVLRPSARTAVRSPLANARS